MFPTNDTRNRATVDADYVSTVDFLTVQDAVKEPIARLKQLCMMFQEVNVYQAITCHKKFCSLMQTILTYHMTWNGFVNIR